MTWFSEALSMFDKAWRNTCSGAEAVMYVLFSTDTTYVGKALLERAKGKLGIKSRIMEHLSAIFRPSSDAYLSIRAKRFRQLPAEHLGFIVAKRGEHSWIKASETVTIRTHRPNGNQGQCERRRARRKRGMRSANETQICGKFLGCIWSLPEHAKGESRDAEIPCLPKTALVDTAVLCYGLPLPSAAMVLQRPAELAL